MTTTKQNLRGGAFLLVDEDPTNVFSPDDFTEEQLLLRKSVQDFLQQKVESRYQDFDSEKGHEIAPGLLEEMGEMGFLGVGVPEAYGGFEADFRTQLAFGEIAYNAWSFGLSIGVQTSLGVAPLLLYGNDYQKAKYLPGIVSAAIKSCYCLTEPGAGSDANSGKTQAVLSADGSHYVLDGQKMWITNSGFADLFFVFAKIENDPNLSCFIVEKAFGGIRLGAEEKKMGIKGSSTRQVFFENVPVPLENLLGERGQGFKIALNVLNTGRIKMSASVTGKAKRGFKAGVQYAKERVQFGKTLGSFGAIQHKIAEMGSRIYTMESISYRIAGAIDQQYDALMEGGSSTLEAKFKSIAEFAMECAMAKVHNTEAEDFIIDESLQIHGGMGYSAESPIETMYRNSRINRIYEGTNEINRMLSIDMLLRKAMQGQLDLANGALAAKQALKEQPELFEPSKSLPEAIDKLKKGFLITAGAVAQKLLPHLKEEQEILMQLADMAIQVYALESCYLRSEKAQGQSSYPLRKQLCQIQLQRSLPVFRQAGQEICFALENPKLLRTLEALCAYEPFNLKAVRREVAEYFIERGQYEL